MTVVFSIATLAKDSVVKEYHQKLDQSTSPEDRAYLFNRLSDLYLDIDMDSARMYADSALLIGTIIRDYRQISDAWVNFGNSYFFLGNKDSARVYYEKSFEAIRMTTELDEIAASLNRLGLIYQAEGYFDQATDYYLKAVRYYEKSQNKKGMANVYNNIGIINHDFYQLESATNYYFKSLKLFRQINEPLGEAQVMNNLGTYYTENHNSDSAFTYIRKAKKIFVSLNSPTNVATCNLNIAILYLSKENTDSAIYYLNKADSLFSIMENISGIASVNFQRGQFYNQTNQPKLAQKELEAALETREKLGNIIGITECLNELANTHDKLGNHQLALEYYKRAQAKADELEREEMQIRFQEMQVRYETEKTEKELILYKKEAAEKRNQNILLIIGIAGFMFISILFFYLFRTKARLLNSQNEYFTQQERLKELEIQKTQAENLLLEEEIKKQKEITRLQDEKYQAELEHKNRELLTSAMHIVNKNKILASMKESLDNISQNTKPEFSKYLRDIVADIENNIHLDSDWDQFKMHFDAVNTNFFEKLEIDFPKLSKSDMKVCAYLKINLSTKEIAQIMNVSPAAVHKRFYRLRLKMELEPNTNLTKFFMSY